MSNQVRWIIQVSKKDKDGNGYDWIDRPDLTYAEWFYSNGHDEPSETLLSDFEKAKTTHDWLAVRLVQENRGFTSKVIR